MKNFCDSEAGVKTAEEIINFTPSQVAALEAIAKKGVTADYEAKQYALRHAHSTLESVGKWWISFPHGSQLDHLDGMIVEKFSVDLARTLAAMAIMATMCRPIASNRLATKVFGVTNKMLDDLLEPFTTAKATGGDTQKPQQNE